MNNVDIKLGADHIWLPYTQMLNHAPQLEVIKTKGSKIYLKNGKILIDGISSWWAVAHGYNHPHIIKNLIKQAKKLPHIMFFVVLNLIVDVVQTLLDPRISRS